MFSHSDHCSSIPPFEDSGPVSFRVTGSTVNEFSWRQKTTSFGCADVIFRYRTGEGTIIDELTINLTIPTLGELNFVRL